MKSMTLPSSRQLFPQQYVPEESWPRQPWPRSTVGRARVHRMKTYARKGFGAALPRLPSLGGKGKVPSGGVAPSPPVNLGIPAELERLWADARDQWRLRSIDQPVLLPAQGAQIHIVPVGADLPADGALIRDVVAAVQPDAIALESPPQHLKSYTSIAKALEPHLSKLLSAASPRSPSAARACFPQAQREQLQVALLTACRGASFKPDPDQLTHLFRLGSLPFVEWLVPAHLVRTASAVNGGGPFAVKQQQQPMLLLSCGLDREARAALPAASLFFGREFDLYLEEVEVALGDEAAGELAAWRVALGDRLEADNAGRELATLVTAWEAQCCLGPEQQRAVAARVEERMREEVAATRGQQLGEGGVAEGKEGSGDVQLEMVRTAADPWVARRLVDLAAGKDVVRPCRRVLAVVGRVHALSVERELRRIAAGQEGP